MNIYGHNLVNIISTYRKDWWESLEHIDWRNNCYVMVPAWERERHSGTRDEGPRPTPYVQLDWIPEILKMLHEHTLIYNVKNHVTSEWYNTTSEKWQWENTVVCMHIHQGYHNNEGWLWVLNQFSAIIVHGTREVKSVKRGECIIRKLSGQGWVLSSYSSFNDNPTYFKV